MIRLYYNRSNDPDGAWSIDAGPGTQEHKCAEVYFDGMRGWVDFDESNVGSQTQPAGWLVFDPAVVTFTKLDNRQAAVISAPRVQHTTERRLS